MSAATGFGILSSFAVGTVMINASTNQFQAGMRSHAVEADEARIIVALMHAREGLSGQQLSEGLGYESADAFDQAFNDLSKRLEGETFANDGGDGGRRHTLPDDRTTHIPSAYEFTVKVAHLFYKEGDRYFFHAQLAQAPVEDGDLSDEQMHKLQPQLLPAHPF